MALTGNKGEWSEIYAFFKLLGEGKIHAGDATMNKINLFYPIINIVRKESELHEYLPNIEKQVVIIVNGEEKGRLPMATFMEQSKQLLSSIKTHKDGTFNVPDAETFMHIIGCEKLKAPSKSKADIHIIIHDLRTGMKPLLGFSIKSQLGSPSTLLNAGLPTNITYRIIGDIKDKDIKSINSIRKHLPRMQAIIEKGLSLKFENIENETFRNNLLFLDTCMPNFIADCLVVGSLPNGTSCIDEVVKKIAKTNPFGFSGKNIVAFYEHKMKVLLLDVALGMTPAKEWTGHYDTNGGYLVIKDNGDIVCYHFYNRNDVEDYLFQNTRFERASRSRYHFGNIYRGDDGNAYIKLNLQIRFKK